MTEIPSHMMAQLQQIIPELRGQLEDQIRSCLTGRYSRIYESRRREIKEEFDSKLNKHIEQSKAQLHEELAKMSNSISQAKKRGRDRKIHLTKEEEEQVVEETIQEIMNQPACYEEIKQKIVHKVQQKVKVEAEQQAEQYANSLKQTILEENINRKKDFQVERAAFWKQASDLELQQLAEEYNELVYRKGLIDEALQTKRSERSNLQKRYAEIQEKKNEMASLQRQAKLLQI